MYPPVNRFVNWLLAAVLGVIIILVFQPVKNYEFLRCWDDHIYVLENEAVREFNLAKIATNRVLGNYHPLTLFSYAVQYHLFGANPRGYHVFSLIGHAVNCLLAAWLIGLLTGSSWAGFLAGLIYGLHPLRIEPVAWISAQKDLLATAGALLMIIAYIYFRRTGRRSFLLLSYCSFGAAVLAKATVLLMPLFLMVLDYRLWPIARPRRWRVMLPFAVLGIMVGVMALTSRAVYQTELGESAFGLLTVCRVSVARLFYYFLGRQFLPDTGAGYINLYGIMHNGLPWWSFIAALLVLSVLAWLVIRPGTVAGKLLIAAAFFMLAIMPVLPAMNLGFRADRFVYLASIGIIYLPAEAGIWLARRFKFGALAASLAAIILAAIFAAAAAPRLRSWQDCTTLTRSFTETYPNDPTAWMTRGLAHADRLDYPRAEEYYTRSLTLNPGYALVYNLRGLVRHRQGRFEPALDDFTRAVETDPHYAEAWYNRGNLYYDLGRIPDALNDYTRAVMLDSSHAETFYNRGNCRARLGDFEAALDDFDQVLLIDPRHHRARINRARLYFVLGDFANAYSDVLKLKEEGAPVDPAFFDTLTKLLTTFKK